MVLELFCNCRLSVRLSKVTLHTKASMYPSAMLDNFACFLGNRYKVQFWSNPWMLVTTLFLPSCNITHDRNFKGC